MEIEACNWSNYRYFHEWQELNPRQKEFLIAGYITVQLIKQHQQDAERLHMKSKRK